MATNSFHKHDHLTGFGVGSTESKKPTQLSTLELIVSVRDSQK